MRRGSARELRELFLVYFEGLGAKRYRSFPLVPDDPTLMFTVAGMVPFKPYFLGLRAPEVARAVTAQKCIRTNDIENVGRTARHHTFFEMLGNFSFGDYFKREIIPWAWTFLTEHIGLDADRLYATVYLDDDEAHDFWRDLVGLSEDRIKRLGDDDNFWAAGPTGPCGPCSEIIYDQGPEFSCGLPGCGVGCDCDRYLEIWNLVFMQYSRDESGTLAPLPKKNIDTGMGLERLASVVQGAKGDFETDLFWPIITKSCEIAGVKYGDAAKSDLAVRVISDHLRASAFMIADGVMPSNDGPGYVLRRLIRRSARYGRLMGIEEPFLASLLPTVNEMMGDPYTELVEHGSTISQVISLEEERFGHTLSQGMELLEDELGRVRRESGAALSGAVAFALYDTYGFPLELTEEISSEAGVEVVREEFDREMDRQRERARASSKHSSAVMAKSVHTELADRLGATRFDGYDSVSCDAEVTAIIRGTALVDSISPGDEAQVFLSRTPFYAERGGQVGDTGVISCPGAVFEVRDTVYPSGELIAHAGRLASGIVSVGMSVSASVDTARHDAVRRHHTATHLLHEALCRVLGPHVRQAGSLVAPNFLRFDFNHFSPLSAEQIRLVEAMVCAQVLANLPVNTRVMSYSESRRLGVKALFEEKYGDVVRVLEIPGFSTELCGGTHARATGDIGMVKITRDESIGSGIRRINAVAGMPALDLFQGVSSALRSVSEILGVDAERIASRTSELLEENRALLRKNQELSLRGALDGIDDRVRGAARIDGVALVSGSFSAGTASRDMLRKIGDRIKRMDPLSVSILAEVSDDGVALISMATDGAVSRGVHAGNLVKEVSAILGGSGGGRPAMGQGGGKNASALEDALSRVEGIVRAQLSGAGK
jgi:alanyl-tRNA synthetase